MECSARTPTAIRARVRLAVAEVVAEVKRLARDAVSVAVDHAQACQELEREQQHGEQPDGGLAPRAGRSPAAHRASG